MDSPITLGQGPAIRTYILDLLNDVKGNLKNGP
jgi:hypothetical protein